MQRAKPSTAMTHEKPIQRVGCSPPNTQLEERSPAARSCLLNCGVRRRPELPVCRNT